MEVVRTSQALAKPPERAVLTIGNFDGLHRGHRAIMEVVRSRASALEGTAVVYTFEPHPRKVIQPDRAPGMLLTLDQKLELLERAGMDLVVLETFTREFAATPPERFVRDWVHARLDPREVYVGYDFHFGRDREGSMRLLTEMGPHLGFSVTVIPEVTVGGRDVNSHAHPVAPGGGGRGRGGAAARAALRGARQRGARRPARADPRLPHPQPGARQRGAAGPRGLRGARRFLDAGSPGPGDVLDAVVNVGRRPTFKEDDPPLAEAHLLDFDGEAYGRRIELAFHHRIREERRFPGPDALREQIGRDVVEGRRLLAAADAGPPRD